MEKNAGNHWKICCFLETITPQAAWIGRDAGKRLHFAVYAGACDSRMYAGQRRFRRASASCADRSRSLADECCYAGFLTYALHQPLADTSFPPKMAQGPYWPDALSC